jgi:ubiquinone/menaquinone biosynthesis C-methylase UbiE
MKFFRRLGGPHDLAVAMIGLKLGDRLLQIGCGDGGLLAALASKVGLTGHAAAIDPSPDAVTRARGAAGRAGVLVEVSRAPVAMLPFDNAAFDVVVVRDLLPSLQPEERVAVLRETARVLRAGGRAVIVEPAPRAGLGALLGPRRDPGYSPEEWLRSENFRAVRRIAERDGKIFVEGVR